MGCDDRCARDFIAQNMQVVHVVDESRWCHLGILEDFFQEPKQYFVYFMSIKYKLSCHIRVLISLLYQTNKHVRLHILYGTPTMIYLINIIKYNFGVVICFMDRIMQITPLYF